MTKDNGARKVNYLYVDQVTSRSIKLLPPCGYLMHSLQRPITAANCENITQQQKEI